MYYIYNGHVIRYKQIRTINNCSQGYIIGSKRRENRYGKETNVPEGQNIGSIDYKNL